MRFTYSLELWLIQKSWSPVVAATWSLSLKTLRNITPRNHTQYTLRKLRQILWIWNVTSVMKGLPMDWWGRNIAWLITGSKMRLLISPVSAVWSALRWWLRPIFTIIRRLTIEVNISANCVTVPSPPMATDGVTSLIFTRQRRRGHSLVRVKGSWQFSVESVTNLF